METLNRFREQFTEKSRNEIIFNPQHLLKTFEIYQDQFDNWDRNQRDLFWRQVIGFIEGFLSAADAQEFEYRIYYLVQDNEPLRYSFNFRFSEGQFYPVAFNSCAGLGFDYGPEGVRVWGRHTAVGGDFVSVVTKFISSKNTELEKLMWPNQPQLTHCVIL
ncbi:MAG: hypothetical protein A3F10_06700 [Coxiella sp. RIFCSPHIGHO2_12_FULL_42_15]|nr:MAG: hypothetical protein A3F10_06700 [Coxiella sp. RIFCSPHIGHO2_12_FULL_42_15]